MLSLQQHGMTCDDLHTAVRCVQNVAASFALVTVVILISAGLLTSIWLRRVLPAPRKVVPGLYIPSLPQCVIVFRHAVSGVLQGSIGFFHPFADSGGGGERVLW